MARKSKVETVREYLLSEHKKIFDRIDIAIHTEDFMQADQLKKFRTILSMAIQLCGEEKPKGEKIE